MNNREFTERFKTLSQMPFGEIVICDAGVFDLV